ncbi:hypothetical protein [Marinomonas transparens]|uniref:Uncharacterized protein n=1 Tax=Marinomonas transparens TaxID=2795388 RepID=A0A934MV08_9GAMM|nr:hypothetical protein [Marinomonas transparens]MBJ7536514.1 hypothetical protein [Marinomonas transparens]
MERIATSLRQRLQNQILLLLGVTFLVMTAIMLYFLELQNRSSEAPRLALRHQIVEQAFNSYLARAEYEMSFISQDLLLKDYKPGRELDMLFSNSDVLFFGGLDFFYIERVNGSHSIDPRARLFTKVDLKEPLSLGKINLWIKTVTDDGAVFLIYKKKLMSEEQGNLGFLYGFISLNNNLTLANELLTSSQADMVRIYDNANNNILLEERQVGENLSGQLLKTRSPLSTPISADLQLELVQKNKPLATILSRGLVPILFINLALFCLYFALVYIIKKWLFLPLKAMAYQNQYDVLPFIELQPLQEQVSQDRAFIKAKESRFQLLIESTHNAIIFCSEVAEIDMINSEAQSIFPDYKSARTVFDFLPITCHQAIQEALKGEVGITFDLTVTSIGRIYHWQAHSFKNESSYRGLVLIGRDITYESSLLWQLEQLRPGSLAVQKKVEVDALLDELEYLSTLPDYVSHRQLQGWLSLLISVLEGVSCESRELSSDVLGEMIAEENLFVSSRLGMETTQIEIECSVVVGATLFEVDLAFRNLLRVLYMLVIASDLEEKRLSFSLDEGVLKIMAITDMASRLLPSWLVATLLERLGGEQKAYVNNLFQLHLPIHVVSAEIEPLSKALVVAWVVNDYSNAEHIHSLLLRLGLGVEQYISADSFFTQSRSIAKFDAVVIGCDQDVEAQANITTALKAQHHRDDLPLVWLNTHQPLDPEENDLTLFGCVFDHNLYKVLQKAFLLDGIVPMNFGNESHTWVIVGGSRVAKAIWYAELEQREIASQWLADLSGYHAVLPYYPDAVVVLLDPQPKESLLAIQVSFPSVHLFALQKWDGMADNVMLFEMQAPYSSDKIIMLKDYVDTKIKNSRSNE